MNIQPADASETLLSVAKNRTSTPKSSIARRSLGRGIGAVAAGFFTVVVLSLGTDQVLHVLSVYPPWGQPMHEPGLNALALSYRIGFTVLGGYVTARLSPDASLRLVWILAGIGLFFGTLGAVSTIPMNLGPAWYPIALALTAVPCTWLGGVLGRKPR
ncbi:MAG TPA: hypothetical protein VG937_10190 [Polyangiaceae bacterium]|jgi:hypothetical protein|nr:hypothetical protein [Polyangiaceae bacterium]